jgi:hypothetical protein
MPKIPIIGDFTVSELKQVITYNPSTGMVDKNIKKYLKKDRKIPFGSITNTYGKSYIRLQIFGVHYMAHRIIWFYMYGVWPDYIDHIDGNGINNKIDNLREVKYSENLKNKRLYSKNKSGISGVTYLEETNNYKVYIISNRNKIYLGRHDSIFEAACAKKSAENKYGFHPNHGEVRPL